jgi:hypothetical protein
MHEQITQTKPNQTKQDTSPPIFSTCYSFLHPSGRGCKNFPESSSKLRAHKYYALPGVCDLSTPDLSLRCSALRNRIWREQRPSKGCSAPIWSRIVFALHIAQRDRALSRASCLPLTQLWGQGFRSPSRRVPMRRPERYKADTPSKKVYRVSERFLFSNLILDLNRLNCKYSNQPAKCNSDSCLQCPRSALN